MEFNDKFGARPSDIYEALMDPRRVEAYTQSSAQIESKEGGKFALFGGNVTGEFVQLVPNERIVQKWRTSTWPEGTPQPHAHTHTLHRTRTRPTARAHTRRWCMVVGGWADFTATPHSRGLVCHHL